MQKGRIPIMVVVLVLCCLLSGAQGQAGVEFFSPQGTVKQVRQVTARFSEPMVAFGDPRLPDPFDISCPARGKGRWVDTRNWVYDFEADLPAGMVCTFRLKPGIKTLSGKGLGPGRAFGFSTGGPAVIRTWPMEYEGGSIDERQIFILTLDAVAASPSVLKHAYFAVQGRAERVGVRIISGEQRRTVLKAAGIKGDTGRIMIVQARQAFSAASQVTLVWGAGIAAPSGVVTDKDQTLVFNVREPFTASFGCNRERPEAPCIPVLPMELNFTSPLATSTAGRIVLKDKTGKVWKARPVDYGWQSGGATEKVMFDGPFPEKSDFSIVLPQGLKDTTGRTLANQGRFPLKVKTSQYPALAKFAARFGILEKADPVLPVTVRNIEAQVRQTLPAAARNQVPGVTKELHLRMFKVPSESEITIINWLRTVAKVDRETSLLKGKDQVRELPFPRSQGEQAFEVVGIPLPGEGFYLVEMESRMLGNYLLSKPGPMFVPTMALVTNLAVHFKQGKENALIWVTALDSGLPVKDAGVAVRDSYGTLLWQGKTDERGVAMVDKKLSEQWVPNPYCYTDEYVPCLDNLCGGFFIFARAGGDMSFTHSSWSEGIEPWRFDLPTADYAEDTTGIAHTILDRSLFRAGDTVHMKHVLRAPTGGGFGMVAPADLPQTAVIQHLGSEQEYRMPLAWTPMGTAACEWKIPEAAKLGTYQIYLELPHKNAKGETYQERLFTETIKVQEFRVPLMKAVIQPPAGPLVRPRAMDLDLAVQYLSGGGAGGLPVKIRAEMQDMATASQKEYAGFVFSGHKMKTGIASRSVSLDEGGSPVMEDEEVAGEGVKRFRFPTQDLRLDAAGTKRARLGGIPPVTTPSLIHTELEFRDPNGEVKTTSANVPVYPARYQIGLNIDSSSGAAGAVKYKVVVLNLKGQPVKGAQVAIDFFRQVTHTHRVRLVGGFYAYQNTLEIKPVGQRITAATNADGLIFRTDQPGASGEIVLQASVKDAGGNTALADGSVWVTGRDAFWFAQGNDDRIDIIPSKKRFEPGETARLQVRMPFREATALVSVEREGIMDCSIQRLSGKNPTIAVPIKKAYAPNVYISALVVRGRVGETTPTATFDPGRPGYKLGIAEVQVGWKGHMLDVEVLPDKKVYKTREKMQVRIRVRQADTNSPPPAGEVAVAAVDEGLLELMPNGSWKLLEGMLRQRPYAVQTATAQGLVVGKRHFGMKALPHGGGGGKQMTRELFDTLLFWKAAVPLDARGEANVQIPLNDALTGFRIVAVAVGQGHRFGTGETSVRTTQDLMLISGLPQLVREGDTYTAGCTVRNTTARPMDVELGLEIKEGKGNQAMRPTRMLLAAGDAKEATWPVTVPYDVSRLTYTITARETSGVVQDRVQVVQKVIPAVAVRTFQATLEQVKGEVGVDVARPADAIKGRGGIDVRLTPSLLAGLSGVEAYMQAYPYGCLEQKTSQAVALRDKARWDKIIQQLPTYLDHEGLLKYFPCARCDGCDILTSYFLSVAHAAGFAIPDDLRKQMIAGLEAFVQGRVIHYSSLPTADLTYRKLAAIEAMSRYQVVDPKLLSSMTIDPKLWPTSAVIDWLEILSRVNVAERNERLAEAQQILRSRLNFQGTTMGFSTERGDYLWWLMISGDSNAARALLALMPMPAWEADMPRMARGLIGRMRQGRWCTTTANAWGVLALQAFARKFESSPVAGTTTARLNTHTQDLVWKENPQGDTMSFPWANGRERLALRHAGTGAPWAMIASRAAIPLQKPISSGFTIKKTFIPVEQKRKDAFTKGDIFRLRLELSAQSDMTWVVVSDPIPAGSMILAADMNSGSQILTTGEKAQGNVWPAYTERSYEAFRQYFEYVPKGKWRVEYTLRFNNDGAFTLPSTRVEALYAPEMFGEIPNAKLTIRPD